MKCTFTIAERFCLVLDSDSQDSIYNYFNKEYSDFINYKDNYLSIIGELREINKADILDPHRFELVNNWLFEEKESLIVKYANKYIRIKLNENSFLIEYEYHFEKKVIFFVTEVLIRIYSFKFGIDFFHASSFRYQNKVYMLNGFGGSGKTEIMVDFLLNGAEFISDDLVIINEEGKLFPYRVNIPIRWKAISEDFIKKIDVSPKIYNICKFTKNKTNRLAQSIHSRFAWKYILGDYSHEQLTDKDAALKYYTVDKCLWLQEANFVGPFDFSNADFFRYMNLCLQNESRKYFDLEGFLMLKFPFLKNFIKERENLRKKICSKFDIKGFAIQNGDFSSVINFLKKN